MTTTTFTSRIKSNSIVSSYNDSTQLVDSIYHVEAYGEEVLCTKGFRALTIIRSDEIRTMFRVTLAEIL